MSLYVRVSLFVYKGRWNCCLIRGLEVKAAPLTCADLGWFTCGLFTFCVKSEKCGVLFHEPGIVDWTSSILKWGRNTWLTHMYILHVTNFWVVGNLNEYIEQTTAQTKFNIWKPYPIKGHIYSICDSDMHTFGSWSVLWCLCTVLVWSTGVMNMCAVTVISNQHFTHSCCM